MSKILITGGSGFIGHNVTRMLELYGHHCRVIDNNTSYGFIPGAELAYLTDHRRKRFRSEVLPYDICEPQAIATEFNKFKPDVLIHLASFPRQKVVNANPILGSQVMSTGLINILENAVKSNVKRFVYVSSSMVYGDFTSNEQSEDADCEPQGQYGILKLAGEWLVKDYARKYGFEWVIVRPSAVYGEWDVEDRVVSKFMIQALRGETLKVNGADEVLDFTYVDDAAQGIALAATMKKAANNTYNITRSDPTQYTLLDAANLAVEIVGKGSVEVKERDFDFPKRGKLSIERAKKDLNYIPLIDVKRGFQRYYDWYCKNPVLWKK